MFMNPPYTHSVQLSLTAVKPIIVTIVLRRKLHFSENTYCAPMSLCYGLSCQ